MENGKKCICNICGLSLDAPEAYNRDRNIKPELFAGTYDFRVPNDYLNRPAQSPLFLFCIDVSAPALQLGIFSQVLTSISAILDYIPNSDKINIGVIAFDTTIQIFKLGNLHRSLNFYIYWAPVEIDNILTFIRHMSF